MIYFEATITIATGKTREFSELLEQHLVPAWQRYGAKLIGSWETAVGTMNEVVNLWSFDNMAHFDESFKSFLRDPMLKTIWPKVGSILLREKNRLLRPLHCSPLK